jgi:mRNA-degrading endonuclease toxin of MazEF toxin-antitoxin module
MPSTTSYKRGEIVLVPFPFTDLTSVKQRPALVVSSDSLNEIRPDVLVAAISSQLPPQIAGDEMLIPQAELAQWGLPKPSVIKLTKLFSIHQSLIRKTLGRAPDVSLQAVLRKIQKQFEP